MGKFTVTDYGNSKEILKYPDHHVSITATFSDVGIVTNSDGRKIVHAGTIVGGGFLASRSVKAVKSVDASEGVTAITAEGISRYDVDVTHGPAVAAVVIHGFVDLAKVPTAPTATQVAALKQITFLK